MSGDRVRDEAGLGMRVQTEGGMEGQKGEGSGLNGCVHYCLHVAKLLGLAISQGAYSCFNCIFEKH